MSESIHSTQLAAGQLGRRGCAARCAPGRRARRCRPAPGQLVGAVGAGVVDDDQLDRHVLGPDRTQAGREGAHRVAGRHDDGDGHRRPRSARVTPTREQQQRQRGQPVWPEVVRDHVRGQASRRCPAAAPATPPAPRPAGPPPPRSGSAAAAAGPDATRPAAPPPARAPPRPTPTPAPPPRPSRPPAARPATGRPPARPGPRHGAAPRSAATAPPRPVRGLRAARATGRCRAPLGCHRAGRLAPAGRAPAGGRSGGGDQSASGPGGARPVAVGPGRQAGRRTGRDRGHRPAVPRAEPRRGGARRTSSARQPSTAAPDRTNPASVTRWGP